MLSRDSDCALLDCSSFCTSKSWTLALSLRLRDGDNCLLDICELGRVARHRQAFITCAMYLAEPADRGQKVFFNLIVIGDLIE